MQKIRDRQLAAPADSETLQDLVRNELKTKSHKATEGLLWLVRLVQSQERRNTAATTRGRKNMEWLMIDTRAS